MCSSDLKENIRECMKRIRWRPVRSGGSGRTDRTMWVVRSDEDGDGWTKMGTNPDTDIVNQGKKAAREKQLHVNTQLRMRIGRI